MLPTAQRAARRRPRLLALVAAAMLAPAAALGWCRTTTLSSQPTPFVCPTEGLVIAWPYACVALHLDPRVPAGVALSLGDLRRVTAVSAEAWSALSCDPVRATRPGFQLQVLGDLAVPVGYFAGGANANTVVLRGHWENDSYHAPDAAALTVVTVSHESGDILDADIELNVRGPENPRGITFTLNPVDPPGTDLQSTLTHEFGHAQGLAHSADSTAVMWAYLSLGEQRRALTDDDARGLCAAYPPTGLTTCDPSLNGISLHGRGVGCDLRPVGARGARSPWAAAALALLAMVASRRRPVHEHLQPVGVHPRRGRATVTVSLEGDTLAVHGHPVSDDRIGVRNPLQIR